MEFFFLKWSESVVSASSFGQSAESLLEAGSGIFGHLLRGSGVECSSFLVSYSALLFCVLPGQEMSSRCCEEIEEMTGFFIGACFSNLALLQP